MRRRLVVSLVATVLIVFGALGVNLVTNNTPILGLDLQGGVSVILAPTEDASQDDLVIVRDLVRDELENFGIAEPDVRVQGETIVVDLPGVDDQQEALDAVDVSGIVQLRPVLQTFECAASPTVSSDGQVLDPATDLATATDPDATTDEPATTDTIAGATPTDSVPDTTPTEPVPVDPVEGEPAPLMRPLRSPSTDVPGTDVPTTEAPTTEVPTTDGAETVPTNPDEPLVTPLPEPTAGGVPGAEILASRDGVPLCAGPDQNAGDVLVFERDGAQATLDQSRGWGVATALRGGEGLAYWNSLAGQCFSRTPTCSTGQLAIVLDDVVQSAPNVNQPVFDGEVSITGSFTETEARDLARVLNRGAFPVDIEAQEARTVSASAGGDSLRAAIIAGLIGVLLVLCLLLAYYRWLALVIIGGLTVWAATVFSVSAFVSGATNYALSLAGVTGIIVAVGVTVDSYVVFFERMKDELRNGRSLKNAAPRSFKVTWRTIWSADLVSVIGAAILFWLSVGSVRGFALYLGITTMCDLFVCYFFTRPAVLLLARSKFMVGRRAFGLEVAS